MKSVKVLLATPMLALGVTLITSSLAAKTIYVAEDGNDDTGDGTAENPYATPKKGVAEAKAETDDVVLLKNGTYTTTSHIVLDKKITLRGESRDGVTVKNTAARSGTARVIKLSKAGARVETMTIRDGKVSGSWCNEADVGGNINMTAAGVISNCVIAAGQPASKAGTLSDGDRGGGNIFATAGTITHCIIKDSVTASGSKGGGICIGGSVTVDTCLIMNNTVGNWGGGIAVMNTSGAKIQNCTIVGNKAQKGGGIYTSHAGTVIKNCIIAGNIVTADTTAGAPNWCAWSSVNQTTWAGNISYTIWGKDGDCQSIGNVENCFCMDPGFTDAATDDYTLRSGSQAIGRGVWYEGIPGDLNAVERKDPPDPGCYQSDHALPLSCIATAAPDKALVGSTIVLSATLENTQPGATYDLYWTVTDPEGQVASLVGETPALVGTKIGNYSVSLAATNRDDATDNAIAANAPIGVFFGPYTNYVTSAQGATPVSPFATPETAATSINAAMAVALPGATVVLDAGEHRVTSAISVETNIVVLGAGRELTTLRSDGGSHRMLMLNDPRAEVSGLTMTGANYGEQGSVVYISGRGGRLIDCAVVGNNCRTVSRTGGTVDAQSSSTFIDRCVFACNTNSTMMKGRLEGLIHIKGGTIRNSLICKNRLLDSYGDATVGKVVYLEGSVRMQNCTIADNYDEGKAGSALYSFGDAVVIQNTILANNMAPNSTSSSAYLPNLIIGGWPTISTCCFVGSASAYGTGSFVSDDAGFVDAANGNYRLTMDSPCRKKGAYAEWMADALDVYGNPRCSKASTVDIGAAALLKQGLVIILR